jgi:hypothetical protein
MTARIFISYRASDGRDKAVALARELGRVFGDDAVFLDKDDLRGGGRWASELAGTLAGRPAMLLLVTPDVLARDELRRLRIADPADPVRHEFDAARAAGAHIVPVLADGVDTLPAADVLGEPWRVLHELTWRRLRAYDWAADLQRLIADLRALGVPEQAAAPAPTAQRRRVWLAAAGATLAAAGAAAGGWWWWQGREEARTPRARIAGRWAGSWPHLGPVVLLLTVPAPGRVLLTSEPIAIAAQPSWADYRAFWRERFGAALDAVMLRGEGLLHADPAQPLRVDIGLALHSVPDSGDKIDGGNFSAALQADGRQLVGTLWLNSRQKSETATLARRRPGT